MAVVIRRGGRPEPERLHRLFGYPFLDDGYRLLDGFRKMRLDEVLGVRREHFALWAVGGRLANGHGIGQEFLAGALLTFRRQGTCIEILQTSGELITALACSRRHGITSCSHSKLVESQIDEL